jgi:hypothetical protein
VGAPSSCCFLRNQRTDVLSFRAHAGASSAQAGRHAGRVSLNLHVGLRRGIPLARSGLGPPAPSHQG